MTIASAEGASENRIFHRKTTCAIIFFFKFQVEGGVPHLSPDSADAHMCGFKQGNTTQSISYFLVMKTLSKKAAVKF